MSIEVKTRTYVPSLDREGAEVAVLITITYLPRGSGNRNKARRLAQAFREHPLLSPHLIKVTAGATAVRVRMRPSLGAMAAINQIGREAQQLDVPGQMYLPLPA